MKKRICLLIAFVMLLTLVGAKQDIKAINFEGQESKYMELCSSSNLSSSNYNTCKEFNNYLKKKNKDLKSSINDTKNKISSTKDDMDKISQQINQLNDEIAKKEQEINYLETSIKNLEANIEKKENEVKDRMYAMQSYNNNNNFVDFIFGAEDFTDFFARVESVNEITEYDKDLVNQLADEKKQVEAQKATVKTAKANIENQKSQQVTLQAEYEKKFREQNEALLQQQQQQRDAANNQEKVQGQLDDYLSLLTQQTQSTSHGVTGDSSIGQAIANKALSKQGCMYLWGGCHSMSEIANPGTTRFDCSGLVSWAFYQAGVNIGSNTTATLSGKGQAISASQLQAGDIILFHNGSGKITHVGIAINNSQMVHAPQTGSPVQVADLNARWRARVSSYRRLY